MAGGGESRVPIYADASKGGVVGRVGKGGIGDPVCARQLCLVSVRFPPSSSSSSVKRVEPPSRGSVSSSVERTLNGGARSAHLRRLVSAPPFVGPSYSVRVVSATPMARRLVHGDGQGG